MRVLLDFASVRANLLTPVVRELAEGHTTSGKPAQIHWTDKEMASRKSITECKHVQKSAECVEELPKLQ